MSSQQPKQIAPIVVDKRTPGDVRLEQVIEFISKNALGTETIKKCNELLMEFLPHIYGYGWESNRERVLKGYNLESISATEADGVEYKKDDLTVLALSIVVTGILLHVNSIKVIRVTSDQRSATKFKTNIKGYIREKERIITDDGERMVVLPTNLVEGYTQSKSNQRFNYMLQASRLLSFPGTKNCVRDLRGQSCDILILDYDEERDVTNDGIVSILAIEGVSLITLK